MWICILVYPIFYMSSSLWWSFHGVLKGVSTGCEKNQRQSTCAKKLGFYSVFSVFWWRWLTVWNWSVTHLQSNFLKQKNIQSKDKLIKRECIKIYLVLSNCFYYYILFNQIVFLFTARLNRFGTTSKIPKLYKSICVNQPLCVLRPNYYDYKQKWFAITEDIWLKQLISAEVNIIINTPDCGNFTGLFTHFSTQHWSKPKNTHAALVCDWLFYQGPLLRESQQRMDSWHSFRQFIGTNRPTHTAHRHTHRQHAGLWFSSLQVSSQIICRDKLDINQESACALNLHIQITAGLPAHRGADRANLPCLAL